ncbi:MAG: YkgJ family cysteine cluster protein [Proteobacteria bacterium]|nr:YkgJ family cysteine cluster protein [Desulfobacterales bacterium]MBU0735043.1 YkgJ family cysteine cluster protein [Pseudomonadota bacterium]MBU1904629.1 YkgJ family cysteine cluster protein [Pseudomonadota bacterium]
MRKSNRTGTSGVAARMDVEHLFQFNCAPDVPCFTECCRDITIVLTPYDVLRLKNALGMDSDIFLDRYTIIIPKEKLLIPMVVLKMNEDDKRCPFVSEKGCTVYADRPWPCRMYPLDMKDDGTFSLITDSSRCKGLKENSKNRISTWLIEQGVPMYDEMNHLFSQVTSPLQAQELDIDNPNIYQMTFMSLYNLDKFRNFVFKSTFLDRFDIDTVAIEKLKRSDVELLKFAFDWIKFGIFGQKTFQVKESAIPKGNPVE